MPRWFFSNKTVRADPDNHMNNITDIALMKYGYSMFI